MKNKLLCIILIFAFSLSLVSCGRTAKRITDEEALAIQSVIDGQLNCDAASYRSAFQPDYDAAISASYELTEGIAFDDYISQKLTSAMESDIVNYGEDIGIEFVVHALVEVDMEKETKYFSSYSDYNVYDYKLDLSKIEKALKAVGTVSVWGDESDYSSTASYIVIKVDGKWYLHPAYYFMAF